MASSASLGRGIAWRTRYFEEEEFTTQFNGGTLRRILALTQAALDLGGRLSWC